MTSPVRTRVSPLIQSAGPRPTESRHRAGCGRLACSATVAARRARGVGRRRQRERASRRPGCEALVMSMYEYTTSVITHGFLGRKEDEIDREELERELNRMGA